MKKTILSTNSVAGFTFIEMLIALAFLGIVSAIAAPSWLALMDKQRLNTAQERALATIRDAQAKAKTDRRTWEACFRDDGTKVLWSINPVSSTTWNCSQALKWEPLLNSDSNTIAIKTNAAYSTLRQNPTGYYRVRFRFDGSLDTQDGGAGNQRGRISLGLRNSGNNLKRCVVVSTLLGAMRTAKDTDCE